MKLEQVPIAKIKVSGFRYRRDAGDIEALAANIAELGLLQPVGIDKYYQLIYGARRLEACQLHLNWEKIPAVIVDIDSVLAGEYSENEFRKSFTPSERSAIGAALEKELAGRHGGDRTKGAIASLAKGKTTTLAAKRAGFKSRDTYQRAKAVVAKGAPELVAAMDAGKVSIDAAAKIASQPKEEQKRIVSLPKERQREIVNRIRKTKADKEKSEKRSFDLRVYRGLHDAVSFVADHHQDPKSTWEGLQRVSAYKFSENLHLAIACLVRLQKEHPNAPRKPGLVAKATR
jgi:ParB family chromosome partitioning protein